MPATATISTFQDHEASVFSVSAADGRTSPAPIRSTLLTEGARFAGTFGALYGALGSLAEQAAPLAG